MVYPATDIGAICQNILNFTEAQANAIHRNGWQDLEDFKGYTSESLMSWMKSSTRLPNNHGGCVFPTVRMKRLCALSYWVNRRLLRGVTLDVADFDNAALTEAISDYPIADLQRDSDEVVDKPESFVYDKWEEWQESVITYLKGKRNVTKDLPLYYVIRPDTAPAAPTEEEEIIFNAPHTGIAYNTDNKAVHQLLTELTNGTDADNWIKQHKRSRDGRAAWQLLTGHYDGPAEGDKRVTVARSDIKLVHYKNESLFTFEKYSTRLKKAFSTLEQYNQPKSEREKVEILLSQINTSDQRLVTAIGICRDSHNRTFEDACTYMSQQVAIIYPQHQPNAFGRRGRGGKRPSVRGISSLKTSKNGKVTCNGVDLTDTTRYLSQKEFTKIGKEGREYLAKCPKRKAAKEAHQANKRHKSSDDSNRHVAAIINGVINATRNENASTGSSIPSSVGGAARPQHGPHARASSAVQIDNASAGASSRGNVTYDHEGNVIS